MGTLPSAPNEKNNRQRRREICGASQREEPP